VPIDSDLFHLWNFVIVPFVELHAGNSPGEELRELASGIDALYLSARAVVPPWSTPGRKLRGLAERLRSGWGTPSLMWPNTAPASTGSF
jgi:hypothetical protein